MTELGQALKDARKEKGMSLDDVQDITKIQKRYLAAIEEGDYQSLPGSFYSRAFIKSYAETVGMDPKELFAQYPSELPVLERGEESPPLQRHRTVIKSRTSAFSSTLPKIIAIVVLLALLFGIWFIASHYSSGSSNSDSSTNSDKGVAYKSGKGIGDKNTDTSKTQTDTGSSATSDNNTDSQGTNGDGNASKADNGGETSGQTLKLVDSKGDTSHYTLSGVDTFVVDVSAKKGTNSWITAAKTDANGDHVYYDFVSNGTKGKKDAVFHKDVSDLDALYIKVGSVPSTVIKINGKPFTYPSDKTVQRITITFKKS